jgi:hypothetical protein
VIVQGSNAPLTIVFDKPVSGMELVVTLWGLDARQSDTLIRRWNTEDMTIANNTVICPRTEAETAKLPNGTLTVEAKGLSGGETVFWAAAKVDVLFRRDRVVRLTGV